MEGTELFSIHLLLEFKQTKDIAVDIKLQLKDKIVLLKRRSSFQVLDVGRIDGL